ncbi:exported hypothetical protein [Candidatus Sulfopaludibacter sp. SbA4]|nr:exported hypothetical protein [Candidatus Sulfopaludibacter sp. SbA4]
MMVFYAGPSSSRCLKGTGDTMSRSSIPLCFLFLSGVAAAQQYIISTVAGGAPLPTPATATTAAINQPFSVATDTTGNVYFGASYCIFKLDTSGVLTRVAGNGRPGYSGDGGPATSAQLSFSLLAGLAVDGQGNIFIADNSRVRRVSPSGTITTVASNGIPGASGDGGPATNAQLVQSSGVAVDAQGNLSIADDTRIRKVSPAGIATTVAGRHHSGGDRNIRIFGRRRTGHQRATVRRERRSAGRARKPLHRRSFQLPH